MSAPLAANELVLGLDPKHMVKKDEHLAFLFGAVPTLEESNPSN